MFLKLKQNRKSDDDDMQYMHKLYSESSQSADSYTNTTSTNFDEMFYAK